MARGYLSLFDDPVAGGSAVLGLLSTGLGLLRTRTGGPLVQGGLGLLNNALAYSAESAREAEKKQAMKDAYAKFDDLVSSRFPTQTQQYAPQSLVPGLPGSAVPTGRQVSGSTSPVGLPTGQAGGSMTPQDALQIIRLGQDAPELAQVGASILRESLKPKPKSEFDQYLEAAGLAPGSEKARRAAEMRLNLEMTPEEAAGVAAAKDRLAQSQASLAERAAYHKKRLAQGPSGFQIAYDAAGNPVVTMGPLGQGGQGAGGQGRQQVVGEVPADVDPRLATVTTGDAAKYKELALEQEKLDTAIKEYRGLIEGAGTTAIPGPLAAKLDNAYRNVQTQVRLLSGMGAPQAAEFTVLEQQLLPPTAAIRNAAEAVTPYDFRGSLLSQIEQTQSIADQNKLDLNRIYLGGKKTLPKDLSPEEKAELDRLKQLVPR